MTAHTLSRDIAHLLAAVVAAMVSCPSPVGAQGPDGVGVSGAAASESANAVTFGVGLVSGLDDVGRFQRFADPRGGPLLEGLRLRRESALWTIGLSATRVGYRDSRYRADVARPGTLQATLRFDQVPTWYSGVSTTPFREEAPGVLRVDDATQFAIQSRTGSLGDFAGALRAVDTRARRDIADGTIRYSATRRLDLTATVRNSSRHGTMPWGASFGLNNAVELQAPLDQRTTDVGTAVEWSSPRGMARVGYDGSFFANAVDTLVWDNPLRLTDQTYASAYVAGDGSGQGRMPLWPDSAAHTVSAAGSVAMGRRSRATASVSVGSWLQDAALVPHTINTAIAPVPLPRATADAEARIVSTTVRVTSRPNGLLWLSGQVRTYDYDNRTPRFPVSQYVRLDGVVGTSVTGGSEPFGYRRDFVDLDASLTPARAVAFRVGYGQERDDRTFRYVETTTEDVVRASVDSTSLSWGSLRLQYDRSERTGRGLDEEVLSEIGEQVSLRQFDISDRIRHRVSAIVQVTPNEAIGFDANVAVARDRRPRAVFGLQENDVTSAAVGLDLAPAKGVDATATYGIDRYATLQRSRQATPGPQFADPTRDWQTDVGETVHTWTGSLAWPSLTRNTALRVDYDDVTSTARYDYVVATGSTLAAPQALPAVRHRNQRVRAEWRYAVTRRVAFSAAYWLDHYEVDDFARSPATLTTPLLSGFMNLLYQWRPYDVQAVRVLLHYAWQAP